ncbi:low-density lipoprotein receptor-related protein 4-like [Haliotis rufescens]|uniref:low-density lipoprotein receptor-related protein 4-like n=1 Tax=Haliotis rufescens TaxID=6454 RepID=UPI00201E90A1|nr:low-density lipoprotein receptor-related protein 4-like [Haliotis rufescens]XP_048259605.1 low-density lipoprotein receptor-related protein 4-like [Haliotis rufescens]
MTSCVLVVVAVLVLGGVKGQGEAPRTRMVVLDKGSKNVFRVDVGLNLSDHHIETFNIPSLGSISDMDYDFVDDRIYVLSYLGDCMSIFVNGTDRRMIRYQGDRPEKLAIEPNEKVIFFGTSSFGRQKILSMGIDGSGKTVLAQRAKDPMRMAVDFQNRYLYWMEFCWCSWMYRMRYDGSGIQRLPHKIHQKISPHSIDFSTLTLYSDGPRGLYKMSLDTGESQVILPGRMGHSVTDTVYDPRTGRIFLTNDRYFDTVSAYTSNGTRLGKLDWMPLTRDQKKIVRINPL